MALPMLLGAAAKGIVKGGGRAAASRIMGRKKTIKPSAITPKQKQQGQQQQRGGALVKSPTAGITKAMAPVKQVSTGAVAKDDYLGSIHKNVLLIESIVTGVYKAEKDNFKEKKQDEQDDARKNQEQKLEAKPQKEDMKKPNLNMVPKLGVFGWIKRFIGNILMGLFLQRMVDFAGFLPGIVRAIDGITTFLADFGMVIVNGLVTFADWGIKAYNFTFGAIEKISGTLFGENADKVVGLIDTVLFLSTTIALSTAGEALMGDGGGDAPGRTPGRRTPGVTQGRGGQRARPRLPGTGPRITGSGSRVGIIGKVKKLFGPIGGRLLGPVFFALDFFLRKSEGQTNLQSGAGAAAGIGGFSAGAAAAAKVLAPLLVTPIPGARILYGLSVFGGGLLGAFGASAITDKITGADKVGQYQEGGRIRRKKVKRGIDIKKKKQRKLRVPKPTKEKLAPLPPMEVLQTQEVKNERAWWDFLGWAGTGGSPEQDKLGPGGKKLAEKVTDVGNKLGENDYFGPILRLTSKVVLDQDITERDYLNVGRGINLLLDDGIRKGAIGMTGYNEGGVVDNIPQMDVTGWVRKTFEDGLKDDLKKKYVKFGSTSGPGSAAGERDSATGQLVPGTETGMVTALGSGGGSLKDMSDQDFSDLAFIVSHEALRGTDDEYGVAAAVLNRVADPRYPNTIMGVGTAPGQFEAVFSGKAYRDETLAKQLKENQGKIVDALKKLNGRTDFKAFSSMSEFMGDSDIMFADSGNFYHYAEQRGKTDPIPTDIPQDWKKLLGESTGQQFTSSTSPTIPSSQDRSGGGDIKVGGSNIVNIGKNLISKGFSVAEHPDFTKTPSSSGGKYTPGKGSISNVHKGRGHYEGRAVDVTDWRGSMEDSKARYRSVLTSLQDNPAIKMLIHDSWGAMYGGPGTKQGPGGHDHPEHMHIEVKDKGGFIGKGLFANLGGTEFVTDADSTAALRQVAPGLMMALNQASDKSGVANVLRDYASYEQGSQQTVVMQDEGDEEQQQESYGGGSPTLQLPPIIMESSNPFEFLEYQG